MKRISNINKGVIAAGGWSTMYLSKSNIYTALLGFGILGLVVVTIIILDHFAGR
ncbi:hypothetical protein J7M02_06735 [Candidatus Aerophobetes bacterium]|nr:hypothetical protein [Candidatus Aerophobetes bacterium]